MSTLNPAQLLKQYQDLQTQAQAANQKRYQDILDLFKGQGETAKADIGQAGAEQEGQNQQSLVSRGLGNTGVLEAYNNATNQQVQREKARVGESVAMNKAGVMERATNAYPNAGLYASLLQSLGAAQGQFGHHQTLPGYAGGTPGGGYAGGGGGVRGGGSGTPGAPSFSTGAGGYPGGGYDGTESFGGETLTGTEAANSFGSGADYASVPPYIPEGAGGSYVQMGTQPAGYFPGEEPMGPPMDGASTGFDEFNGSMAPNENPQSVNPQESDTSGTDELGSDALGAAAGGNETFAEPQALKDGDGQDQQVLAVTNAGTNKPTQRRMVSRTQAKWSPEQQYWYVPA